jgi:hypothetical protein
VADILVLGPRNVRQGGQLLLQLLQPLLV